VRFRPMGGKATTGRNALVLAMATIGNRARGESAGR
jgi:hypothetical protein